MPFLIVIVVLFALMWVFLIRPQKRRQLQQQTMIDTLQPGDEIVTAGGLYGFVREIAEAEVTVEIAPGTNVRIAKRAVAAVLPEDEEDDEEEEEDEPAELAAASERTPAMDAETEPSEPGEADRRGAVPS